MWPMVFVKSSVLFPLGKVRGPSFEQFEFRFHKVVPSWLKLAPGFWRKFLNDFPLEKAVTLDLMFESSTKLTVYETMLDFASPSMMLNNPTFFRTQTVTNLIRFL